MRTVVIIGAGFSGTAMAINLLHQGGRDIRVILINRSGSMARGLAYGTSSAQHLLNVPAGNMSVLADDKDDFLRFCRDRWGGIEGDSFVPRKVYGDYLNARLDEADRTAGSAGQLLRLNCEARRISATAAGGSVELDSGEVLHADHIVLAFGHFSPRNPRNLDAGMLGERYRQDPWGAASGSLRADQPVLLVGAGLTALDVVTSLLQNNHRGPIHMISRRGLLPLPHRSQHVNVAIPDDFVPAMLALPPSIRSYMRELRRQIRLHQQSGLDWRDLIAALRPVTATLWQRLSLAEKRRFLRHVQPYWDVHRHRVAPESFRSFQQALDAGQLQPLAGHILSVTRCAEGIEVALRLRGSGRTESIQVVQVINCTGPNSNLELVDDALICQLRSDGLIQSDKLGLGIEVDGQLAAKGGAGHPISWLSYVGPMLKGEFWEATAVPELRVHAARLAHHLIEKMADGSSDDWAAAETGELASVR